MKKIQGMITAVVVAGVAQAAVITNFYSDLSGSADGAADNANLNAGTAVGSWNGVTPLDSYVTDGIAHLGVGTFAYQLWLAPAAIPALAQNPAVHIEFRAAVERTTDQWVNFAFKDDDAAAQGNNLISLRSNGWGGLQLWNQSTGQWITIGTSTIQGTSSVPGAMNSLDIVFASTGAEISYNGSVVTTTAYVSPVDTGFVADENTVLRRIQLSGTTANASTMWFDNISVTTIPEPATVSLLLISSAALLAGRHFVR